MAPANPRWIIGSEKIAPLRRVKTRRSLTILLHRVLTRRNRIRIVPMTPKLLPLLVLLALTNCHRSATKPSDTPYFPAKGQAWAHRQPAQVGMDAARLDSAVAFANTQETKQMAPDFSTQEVIFGKLLGPMPTSRAKTNGLVIRHGYIVAEWGDTDAVDPTYSVAKSVLSTVLGISLDRGLIKDIHDPVATYIHDGGYESEQNRRVTWQFHAQQTSEWAGNMWGKNSDFVGKEAFGQGERKPRPLNAPGTYWEYNDVRINRFALSLLRLWKKPLPDVVRDEIFNPIGASTTWQYIPYPVAVADVAGKQMPSVSGGTRWGGGLRISARDEARFGYLFLRNGRWAKQTDRVGKLGKTGHHARHRRPGLRLSVVAEYRAQRLARRPRHQLCRPRCGVQHHLRRSGQRSGYCLAVAQRQPQRTHQTGAGGRKQVGCSRDFRALPTVADDGKPLAGMELFVKHRLNYSK